MDSGAVDGPLYSSSECTSPFTSTSSMDSSLGDLQQPTARNTSPSKKQRSPVVTVAKSHDVSHKRPLSISNSGLAEMLMAGGDASIAAINASSVSQAKRIKCDNEPRAAVVLNSLTSASPQLLQQLMAPTKASQNLQAKKVVMVGGRKMDVDEVKVAQKVSGGASRSNDSEGNNNKKGFAAGQIMKKQQQQQQQASNSVLMNLLVSGCDVSAGYMCLAPMRPRKTAKV